jgi:HlyD family secretion protein
MNASVAFVSDPKPPGGAGDPAAPIVLVPSSAVRDNAVFVVLDGKALRRPVKVGAAAGERVRVDQGLAGGEDLITNPPAGLKDGDKVTEKRS